MRLLLDILHRSRMSFGGMAAGFARRLLDEGLARCRERRVGGKSLIEYDQVERRLSEMQAAHTIAAAFCAHARSRIALAKDLSGEGLAANIHKAVLTDFMQQSSQSLLQLSGAEGYRLDSVAGRAIVDSRPFQIFEGSNDVLYDQVASSFLAALSEAGGGSLAAFLARHELTSRAAGRFAKLLDFSVGGSSRKRRAVDLGRILARVAASDLLIRLGDSGYDARLVENAVAVLEAETAALARGLSGGARVGVVEDYGSGRGMARLLGLTPSVPRLCRRAGCRIMAICTSTTWSGPTTRRAPSATPSTTSCGYRVREVLLVASLYDAFVIEADGVLTEQIYGEYFQLHLNTVPRITCAYSPESALEMLRRGPLRPRGPRRGPRLRAAPGPRPLHEGAPAGPARPPHGDEQREPRAPSRPIGRARLRAGLEAIDRVFVWNGYSKLFVGMLKLIEDLRNVDADTRTGLVRVVLLIEDSVRYYSRYLPLLFQVVQRQAQALIEAEKGVETQKLLRSRSRPKILLASSYEEAVALFERYEPYLLTVITDVRFPRGGKLDPEAGFDFLRMAKSRLPALPVMIQSSEGGVAGARPGPGRRLRGQALRVGRARARRPSSTRAWASAPSCSACPDGAPVAEARDVDEFLGLLEEVPEECLYIPREP